MVNRMTKDQSKKVYNLLKKECCNYYDGKCLLLDDACPQLVTQSLICKYFKAAVLPGDQQLEAEIMRTTEKKRCKSCRGSFVPTARNQQYCPACAEKRKRHQAAERQRKYREKKQVQSNAFK